MNYYFAVDLKDRGGSVIVYGSERQLDGFLTMRRGYVGCNTMEEALTRCRLMDQGENKAYGPLTA